MNQEIKNLKSFSTLLGDAFSLTKSHIHVLALITIIPVVFSTAVTITMSGMGHSFIGNIFLGIISAILVVTALVTSIISPIVLVRAIDALKKGGIVDVLSYYKKALRDLFPYLWVGILTVIIVFGGMTLFIIPGIILSVYFIFSLLVFSLEGKRGFSVLTSSAKIVEGNFWRIVGVSLLIAFIVLISAFIVTILAGFITMPIGLGTGTAKILSNIVVEMLITPFAMSFVYFFYKDLTLDTAVEVTPQFEKRWKNICIGTGILFVVGIIVVTTYVILVK